MPLIRIRLAHPLLICHSCVAASSSIVSPPAHPPDRFKSIGACEKRCVQIVNTMYKSRVFTEICASSGAAVCQVVKKMDGRLPTSFSTNEYRADAAAGHDNALLNKRRNACFCMQHCNADITCSLASSAWPQSHSTAEAAVVIAATAQQHARGAHHVSNDEIQAICRWAHDPEPPAALCHHSRQAKIGNTHLFMVAN